MRLEVQSIRTHGFSYARRALERIFHVPWLAGWNPRSIVTMLPILPRCRAYHRTRKVREPHYWST
jgi:hypothetical protein